MENLFRTELIQSFAKAGQTSGIGEWCVIDGENCICTKPYPFYKNLPENASGLLVDLFAPNTQYIFNFWINSDYSKNTAGTAYSTGGFTIYYSDGTSNSTFLVTGYDGAGFQHKKLITAANKTISKISIRYGYNAPVYYRWDSYICPITTLNVSKNGQLNTIQLIEDQNSTVIHNGGSIHTNNLYEY